ncbi:signal peptidase I [Lebetimonas natsushimae]|uniref:Signal peptidase I n=1 Tax=Lebetimonas natsushimae TaxID=1936991 RepID=A0A292YBF1_9BACT|nr:signal peptidase I [Lebetimonas natsushimae]GAX87427.1 signal peptidase I [Lebetimonas natsushimae]
MKEKLKKLYNWSNTWTGTIVIVLIIIFFLAQAFVIPSGSMKRTLLPGDALFAKKFAYGVPIPHIPWLEIPLLPDFRGDGHLIDGPKPKRGDIVIFRYPVNPKMHFVKRCVAVGGDKLMVRNKDLYIRIQNNDEKTKEFAKKMKADIATINGEIWVKNPYMKQHLGIHHDPKVDFPEEVINYGPIIVPKGQFFMMGDNRDHSDDSRFWGPVPYKLIVGKPWFIYMSWDENYTIRWHRVGMTVDEIEKELRVGKKPYLTYGCKTNEK